MMRILGAPKPALPSPLFIRRCPPPYLHPCTNKTHIPLCRNFTAGAEGFNNTWANYYPPFIRTYAPDGVSALTSDEVRNDVDQIWRYFVGTYWALTTVSRVEMGV